MTLSAGTRLGPYEIAGPIGAGGMGEVYRARDTRLGRDVAVKVLLTGASHTPERLHRFEQEARLAGSLNNPNVLTLFDVGSHEGAPYLVTELLEGRTLRDVLAAGPLPSRRAIDYGQQVARGLAAAHEKGVVHRDLKPANLFVTKDGRVKILDFGLAKLTQPDPGRGGSQFSTDTAEGHVVGTLGYMAPEQVRGQAVDPRTDIFAFGAVVYEMLSGHRAFAGDTPADTMSAILTKDPDELSRPGLDVPGGLELIVRRCLEKDPAERFQSAKDVAFALEAESGSSRSTAPAVTGARRGRWSTTTRVGLVRWRWPVGVATALAVLLAGWLWLSARRTPAPDKPLTAVPLTSLPGAELHPALSPDGRRVAFTWDGPDRNNFDVYVKDIGTGEMVRVTSDPAADYHPVWSPDGRRLAFLRRHGTGAAVVLVPASGGPERQLAEVAELHRLYQQDTWSFWLDWSPDGRFLALSDRSGERWGVFLVSVETGEKRSLTATGNPRIVDRLPAFSPDGRQLAFLRGDFAPSADLLILPLSSEMTSAAPASTLVKGVLSTPFTLSWMPAGDELVLADQRVSLNGSSPRPLGLPGRGVNAGGYGNYGNPEQLSIRGTRLVFSAPQTRVELLRVPLSGIPKAPAVAFVPSTRGEGHPAFSPDGRRVAFCSGRSGDSHIWVCNVDGSACHELAPPGGSDYACSPSWSPDGRRLAFDASIDGRFHVYVAAPDGGTIRPLTSAATYDSRPRWSQDGRWIYHTSTRDGDFQIWKTPADGPDGDTAAVRITPSGGIEAEESPDGRYLYYAKHAAPGVFRLPLEGPGAGVEEKLLDIGGEGRWCLGPRGIYVLDDGSRPAPVIRLYEPATGRTYEVRELPPEWSFVQYGGAFAVSPDGQWALVTRERVVESDITLVEGFR